MLSVAVARHDVVEGEVSALLAAVLAGVFVAVENLVAGHLSFTAGALYHLAEPYDRWYGDGSADGVQVSEAIFQHLCFALVDEDNGAAGAADGERLVALI